MASPDLSPITQVENELKALIIDVLVLEDITPDEIVSSEPLFVDGLGLDSIDALEIAMALEERYGIVTGEDADENKKNFASVAALAAFVAASREN
jgi:acyl carrier protein